VSSFGVVLDACVLIPASLRDTLLRAAEQGMYQMHWSELILEEVISSPQVDNTVYSPVLLAKRCSFRLVEREHDQRTESDA